MVSVAPSTSAKGAWADRCRIRSPPALVSCSRTPQGSIALNFVEIDRRLGPPRSRELRAVSDPQLFVELDRSAEIDHSSTATVAPQVRTADPSVVAGRLRERDTPDDGIGPNSSMLALRGRLAAHVRWSRTVERSRATANARAAFLERFDRQVDPDGLLPASTRHRLAENARKAYFTRMALRPHKGSGADRTTGDRPG